MLNAYGPSFTEIITDHHRNFERGGLISNPVLADRHLGVCPVRQAVFCLWYVETYVTFRILPCQAGLNIETIDIDSCKHSCLVTYLILQTYVFHLLIVYRQRFDNRERGIDSNFSSPVECLVFDLDKLRALAEKQNGSISNIR